MDLLDIYAKIILDSSGYEKGVDAAVEKGKQLASEMDKSVTSTDTLGIRIAALADEYQKAQARIADYSAKLKEAAKEKGTTADETKKLAAQVTTASKNVSSLGKQLLDLKQDAQKAQDSERMLSKKTDEAAKSTDDLRDSAKKAGKSVEEMGEKSEKSGNQVDGLGGKIAGGLATAAKVGAAAAVTAIASIAAAASSAISRITDIVKLSVDAYGNYEQLVGGVKTLFGTEAETLAEYAASIGMATDEAAEKYNSLLSAQSIVFSNAENAYKNAGLSANAYMETVTGFSASLIQSLGGDTERAAELANTAIVDMADNANKMGTDISMIQSAYQGFAKQNYTMLDNLKLGYGGTATEMARLINESGVLGDKMIDLSKSTEISSQLQEVGYAKIIEAIHAVQTEMNITDTTLKEAAGTIQGSVAAVKAAAENLISGFGNENADLPKLIGNFTESVVTATENIVPRIGKVLSGIGSSLISFVSDQGSKLAPMIEEMLPGLIEGATAFISGIASAAQSAVPIFTESILPQIANAIPTVLDALVSAGNEIMDGFSAAIPALVKILTPMISSALPLLTNAFLGLGSALIGAIASAAPNLIGLLADAIPSMLSASVSLAESLATAIAARLPDILKSAINILPQLSQAAATIILAIVRGLADSLPELIPAAAEAVSTISEALTAPDMLGEIINAGIDLLVALVDGISDALPELLYAAVLIAGRLQSYLTDPNTLAKIINAALRIVLALASGLISSIPALLKACAQICGELANKFIHQDWKQTGRTIIDGILDGIKRAWHTVVEWVQAAVNTMIDGINKIPGVNISHVNFSNGNSGGSASDVKITPQWLTEESAAFPSFPSGYGESKNEYTIYVNAQTDDLGNAVARELQNMLSSDLANTGDRWRNGRTSYAY